MSLPEPRCVVTELEGWTISSDSAKRSGPPGIAVHVLDRHLNYKLLGSWRTEDVRWAPNREGRRSLCRERAREHCDRLNREHCARLNDGR